MRTVVRRTLAVMLIAAMAAAGAFVYYGGRFLQHEDPLQRADAIFVLAGARAERWLEAYDLYKAGYAPAILLSPGRMEAGEALLRDRGIRFPADVELQRDALVQLGVPPDAIVARVGTVDNTAQEAELLRGEIQRRGWRRVIIVTSKLHTRRSGFAFRRAFAGSGVAILTRASRYDPADPARWWRSRSDLRFTVLEWEKLIAYRLGAGG